MNMHLSEDFAGWPPEKTVFPIETAELRILPGEHPFCSAERDAISTNWEREVAANPALFDGRMVLQRRIRLDGDGLVAEGHVVPFSAFMWWRKQPDRRGGIHMFPYPVLETTDGALVAIRMGSHTANAGQVYFACGSFEPDDIFGGRCDIEHNMRREVHEETGLQLGEAISVSGYFASHFRRAVNIFRVYTFDMTAVEMIARIESHMLVAEDKEIAGAVAIRSADHSAYPYNVGMLPVIDWYFAARNEA